MFGELLLVLLLVPGGAAVLGLLIPGRYHNAHRAIGVVAGFLTLGVSVYVFALYDYHQGGHSLVCSSAALRRTQCWADMDTRMCLLARVSSSSPLLLPFAAAVIIAVIAIFISIVAVVNGIKNECS